MRNSSITDLTGNAFEVTAPILPATGRRSIDELLEPLNEQARRSSNLVAGRNLDFMADGQKYFLPCYHFVGPKGGDAPVRLGLFGVIHGDEAEGAYAAIRFLSLLEDYPELATGYHLFVYPLCNPTGFEGNTRHSRHGKDLNREFWKNSSEPEVRLLEAELVAQAFHGILSLHIDDTANGFYGYAGGAVLTKHLITPALEAADSFLPLDERPLIDGFPARKSVVRNCFPGVLSAPPGVRPRPFEIILEAPRGRPAYRTEWAFAAALQSILVEYRKFIAYARNL